MVVDMSTEPDIKSLLQHSFLPTYGEGDVSQSLYTRKDDSATFQFVPFNTIEKTSSLNTASDPWEQDLKGEQSQNKSAENPSTQKAAISTIQAHCTECSTISSIQSNSEPELDADYLGTQDEQERQNGVQPGEGPHRIADYIKWVCNACQLKRDSDSALQNLQNQDTSSEKYSIPAMSWWPEPDQREAPKWDWYGAGIHEGRTTAT